MSRSILALSGAAVVAALALAAIDGGLGPPESSKAGASCGVSYAMWRGLSGHWEGTWTNHTFNSNGAVIADLVINEDCTAEATVEGIFNQSGPKTINATYHDGNSAVIEVQNDPVFGDTTITIEDDGTVTLNGAGLHQAIASVTGTGTVSPTELNLDIELNFMGGGTATETIHAEKEVTDTPTPTPTLEPTPSPSPTAAPDGLV